MSGGDCIAAQLNYVRTESDTDKINAIRIVAEQFIAFFCTVEDWKLVGWALPTISITISRLVG